MFSNQFIQKPHPHTCTRAYINTLIIIFDHSMNSPTLWRQGFICLLWETKKTVFKIKKESGIGCLLRTVRPWSEDAGYG